MVFFGLALVPGFESLPVGATKTPTVSSMHAGASFAGLLRSQPEGVLIGPSVPPSPVGSAHSAPSHGSGSDAQ